jgi:hypothetical protein
VGLDNTGEEVCWREVIDLNIYQAAIFDHPLFEVIDWRML